MSSAPRTAATTGLSIVRSAQLSVTLSGIAHAREELHVLCTTAAAVEITQALADEISDRGIDTHLKSAARDLRAALALVHCHRQLAATPAPGINP